MNDEIKEIISMSADEDIEIKYINEKGSYVYKNIDIYELLDYITNLQEEIERLNNLINELEKWLDKKEKLTFNSWNKGIHEVQRKLQELKEGK